MCLSMARFQVAAYVELWANSSTRESCWVDLPAESCWVGVHYSTQMRPPYYFQGSFEWFRDVVGLPGEGLVLRSSRPHLCNGKILKKELQGGPSPGVLSQIGSMTLG